MRKVAIVGVGHTKFGFNSPLTSVEMLCEAAMDAINESNISPRDIQAAFIGNVLGDFEEGQGMVQSYFINDLGCDQIPATRFEGACASGTMAIRDAYMWVASGYYDIVIAGGTERATAMGTSLATRTFAMFGDSRWEYPSGFTFPGAFGLLAHLYADRYGIPLKRLKEQMAAVSVQSHQYGMNNPHAQFHEEITIDDVLKSFMVTTPLQLHDCCPFSDGAAAVIVASEEVAKKLIDKPVYITGVGQSSSPHLAAQRRYLPRLRARELASQQAYSMAGVTPQDIDICELHDCFSIASLIAAESLGFLNLAQLEKLGKKVRQKLAARFP